MRRILSEPLILFLVLGGLMYWADGVGVQEVYNQIAAWHQAYGDRWAPSALLRQLAESGTAFREAHTLVK